MFPSYQVVQSARLTLISSELCRHFAEAPAGPPRHHVRTPTRRAQSIDEIRNNIKSIMSSHRITSNQINRHDGSDCHLSRHQRDAACTIVSTSGRRDGPMRESVPAGPAPDLPSISTGMLHGKIGPETSRFPDSTTLTPWSRNRWPVATSRYTRDINAVQVGRAGRNSPRISTPLSGRSGQGLPAPQPPQTWFKYGDCRSIFTEEDRRGTRGDSLSWRSEISTTRWRTQV